MFTSGDVARYLGVSRVTVLNWEKRGILLPDEITPTGRKFYEEEKIKQFKEAFKYGSK